MSSSDQPTLSDQAWALVEGNRLREAQELFTRVCELDEADAEAWMMRGSIHGEFGETDAAVACLERAITLDPGYADAYLNLGKIQLSQDKAEPALESCRKAVECDPEFAEAWMLSLSIQDQLGRWTEAEQACRVALAHQSGDPRALAQLARIADTLRMQQLALARLGDTRPIFVLGIPRSGTSMIAGALHLCGAWIGTTVSGGPSNPEGFFENVALREGVLKPMLERQGADPLGVRTLPDLDHLTPFPELKNQVLKQLVREAYPGEGQAWLYKDCKLTLLWPLWREAFPDARWVIVRRPEDDIVRSCLRTRFMNQHSIDSNFWRLWISEYEKRLDALRSSGVWWREIDSHAAVISDLAPIRSLVNDLCLIWNEQAVRDFIKPQHWHATSNGTPATSDFDQRSLPSAIANTPANRVLLNSVAKAGTYLLTRTVELMQVEPFPFVLHGALAKRTLQVEETADSVLVGVDWPCLIKTDDLRAILAEMPTGQFMKGHLPYSPRVVKMLEDMNYKMVIIVRDPRDVAVSHMNWALAREYLPYQKYYKSLSPDERMSLAISGFAIEPEGPVVLDLRKRFEHITKWISHPMAYVTSFERLVGPKGGGSLEAQREEISNIGAHLGLLLSQRQVDDIADNLFGGTMTFKEGKIGAWNKHFSDAHRQQIKNLMGDIIIDLGYEKDSDW